MIFTENRYDRSIERMMKGIPNFYPRSSGIVVTGRFQYTAEICLPQIKKAISKEKLTKRGLVSPLDYYLKQHTLKLN